MSAMRTDAVDRQWNRNQLQVRADAKRPLRIVIGLEGLALGGCPINAIDLGRALRLRGHEVSIFAIDENVRVSLIPYAEQSGFKVTILPATSNFVERSLQIRRFARSRSADVVHVFAPWLGQAASMAAVSRRTSLVVVTNWMMVNVSYTPAGMPMVLGTRALQEEAQLVHRSRVWLMEPPVDLEREAVGSAESTGFRREMGVADDDVLAVIVSRIDSHMKAEGIVTAIRAISELDLLHVKLVIVGDGNAFDVIQSEAEIVNRKLGRKAVILRGAMYDPRPAYSAADITLGMGGSAVRCLAHAKPLIVLGENGFARTFGPDSVAYFMESGFFGSDRVADPIGHITGQVRTLMDQELRAALGQYGLAQVSARFGLDATTDALEGIYSTELAEPRSLLPRCFDAVLTVARVLLHDVHRVVKQVF